MTPAERRFFLAAERTAASVGPEMRVARRARADIARVEAEVAQDAQADALDRAA
jgi:hypothetical protein